VHSFRFRNPNRLHGVIRPVHFMPAVLLLLLCGYGSPSPKSNVPQEVTRYEQAVITVKGQTATLHVSEGRPLAAALYALSQRFGWRFGFEEARLRYRGDVVDVTSPKYVSKSADDRAYDPRGGVLDLTFTLSAGAGQSADPRHVVEQLLAQYHARGYPGRYSFEAPQDPSGYICVFPVAAANERGVIEPQESVVRRTVTVAVRERETLDTVLQGVLNQLGAASGARVWWGGMAMSTMSQPAPLPVQTTKEPAYLFVNWTAAVLHSDFWQVLWDFHDKYYVLGYGH